jgi:hypothetical protein
MEIYTYALDVAGEEPMPWNYSAGFAGLQKVDG